MFNINIIKPLLFIILIIFINEVYKNILKLQEIRIRNVEGFSCDTNMLKKNNPFLVDIKSDDSIEYSAYKPFTPSTKYYGNRYNSFKEGHRRNIIEEHNIKLIKNLLNNPNLSDFQKDKIEKELKLYDWRNYIYKPTKNDGSPRLINDIKTDYDPNIIGFQRSWEEYGTRNNIHKNYADYDTYYSIFKRKK